MNRSFHTISINTGRLFLLVLMAFFISGTGYEVKSQTIDSVQQLKIVTISADRINLFSQGMKIISFDSITLDKHSSDNAAELLASQSTVYVKSYGQGGLATLSIRGTMATHAGVYWNGVDINQPNLGMTDISLIPVFFFESVVLQYGGSSSLFGSGNIGGGLHLDNDLHFAGPLKLKASFGIGSFNEYSGNIKISYAERNTSYSIGISVRSQENNFPYTNPFHQREYQKNAATWNMNTLQQLDIKTGRNSTLSAGMWLLNSNRQLPSSMIASSGKENQEDQSLRTYLKWMSVLPRNTLILRSALLVEKMHYNNSQVLIDAFYLTRTALLECENRWQISREMILGLAGSLSEQNAEIAAYSGDKHQLKGSISASLQRLIPINNWAATLLVRKELIEGYQVPLCPSIGASGNLNRFLSAQLHLSRNFRVPTLNDRYWQPGGNESLKPETSWSAEAGINWKSGMTDRCWQTGIGITAYYSLIRDLILWSPGDNSIWSPENIQEVLSRGLEFSSTSEIKVNKFAGKLHLAYSYTPSEFNKNETGSNSVKGNQLTYIPLHNAITGLRVSWGSYFIDWEQSLLGKRYVLKDNSVFLDGYSLGNLKAGSIFTLNNIKLSLQGEIRNLFDTDYQSIQYYAVPGRSFRLTINFIL